MNARRSLAAVVFPLLVAASVAPGCASTGGNGRVTARPFPAELGRHFDDGADYIENVEELGGPVAAEGSTSIDRPARAAEWRTSIDTLAREADLIVVVHVETVTGADDAASSRNYRLTALARGAPLRGTVARDGIVDLRTEEGAAGYNTIRGNYTRLQSRNFLLFARYYNDPEGVVRPRWHLTPDTPAAQQRARDAIGYIDPNAPTETVVRSR